MLKRATITRLIISLILLTLPGCKGYINWGACPWHHCPWALRDIEIGRQLGQSVAVFDKYSARIIFDAMPLSDKVRAAYARMQAGRFDKNDKWLGDELARQIKMNKEVIAFYSPALREMAFGDRCGEWTPLLKVGGTLHNPIYIKHVDPPVEYKHMLGPRYTRFKIIYEIGFAAQDKDGRPIIQGGSRSISLVFQATGKNAQMSWPVGVGGVTFGDDSAVALDEEE